MSKSFRLVFLAAVLGLIGTASFDSRNFSPDAGVSEKRTASQLFWRSAGTTGWTQSKPEGLLQSISATTNNTISVKLSDLPVGKVIQVGQMKFVKVGADQYQAINLCPTGSTYMAAYKGCVVKQTDFSYTGGEQTFTASADGYYVLEVWGAQGGDNEQPNETRNKGGFGGYSSGIVSCKSGETLNVVVGGAGKHAFNTEKDCEKGGYNGGGNLDSCGQTKFGNGYSTTGGGATHVAKVPGELKNLSIYKDTDGLNISKEILIVAGAGGGTGCTDDGKTDVLFRAGSGGGISGTDGQVGKYNGTRGEGGHQDAGGSGYKSGSFGVGGNGYGDCGGSGGGGWYGGGGSQHYPNAGGGSGYIGSSNLVGLTNFSKHMTCYECSTSANAATYTISNTCVNSEPVMDCSKTGHGAARITQLSVYLGI